MAQNYVVMARKNLLKPSEAPKYYAVARSGRKVTVNCIRVTVSPIRETNRCRTMVRAISPAVVQVTMAMKLRTRLFNQSLFTIKN